MSIVERLKRKIDTVLVNWKNTPDHMPLIIKGARQIGKTEAIKHFAEGHYKSLVEINFVLQKQYKDIFDDGFEVDTILKNISLRNPDFEFIPGETQIFFDELQDCINCATSLKSFRLDGRFDVICSGSLMGINYNEIKSNGVGNKKDVEDFSKNLSVFSVLCQENSLCKMVSGLVGIKPSALQEKTNCKRQIILFWIISCFFIVVFLVRNIQRIILPMEGSSKFSYQ